VVNNELERIRKSASPKRKSEMLSPESTFSAVHYGSGPLLWSSGQSFWLQIHKSRVRFPALPDFLRSRGSGMGSTQPREDNWGAT
jgi:hypothetical protein